MSSERDSVISGSTILENVSNHLGSDNNDNPTNNNDSNYSPSPPLLQKQTDLKHDERHQHLRHSKREKQNREYDEDTLTPLNAFTNNINNNNLNDHSNSNGNGNTDSGATNSTHLLRPKSSTSSFKGASERRSASSFKRRSSADRNSVARYSEGRFIGSNCNLVDSKFL